MKLEEIIDVVRAYQRSVVLSDMEDKYKRLEERLREGDTKSAETISEWIREVLNGTQVLQIFVGTELGELRYRRAGIDGLIQEAVERAKKESEDAEKKEQEALEKKVIDATPVLAWLKQTEKNAKPDRIVGRVDSERLVRPVLTDMHWTELLENATDLGKYFQAPLVDAQMLDKSALWAYLAAKYGLNINDLPVSMIPIHKKALPPAVVLCPRCKRDQMPKGEKECRSCGAERRAEAAKALEEKTTKAAVKEFNSAVKRTRRELDAESKRARRGRSGKPAGRAR